MQRWFIAGVLMVFAANGHGGVSVPAQKRMELNEALSRVDVRSQFGLVGQRSDAWRRIVARMDERQLSDVLSSVRAVQSEPNVVDTLRLGATLWRVRLQLLLRRAIPVAVRTEP